MVDFYRAGQNSARFFFPVGTDKRSVLVTVMTWFMSKTVLAVLATGLLSWGGSASKRVRIKLTDRFYSVAPPRCRATAVLAPRRFHSRIPAGRLCLDLVITRRSARRRHFLPSVLLVLARALRSLARGYHKGRLHSGHSPIPLTCLR